MAEFLFIFKKDLSSLLELAKAARDKGHQVAIFFAGPGQSQAPRLEDFAPQLAKLQKQEVTLYYAPASWQALDQELPIAIKGMLPKRLDELGELIEKADHILCL